MAAPSSTRTLWKGAISFGLVHIPVTLHSAVAENRMKFNLLDKQSMAPVGNRQVNKATGEAIDQLDNRKFNALAYALERRDLEAARRLLRLGARPDTLVGEADMPVALLPVISADLDAVRLMRQFRVDYSKLRFQGSTAIDHAKRIGDRRLLEALGRETGAL